MRLAPTLILIGVFLLGFLGSPENSGWLNRSPLWGPGDPFFTNTEKQFVASPPLVWRGRPNFRGDAAYPFAGVPNPLFASDRTLMCFADGKVGVLDLISALKEAA